MKQQTAVEWLQDQFKAFGTISDSNDEVTHQLIKSAIDMCERAKEMEREQIMEAHYAPKYGCFSEQYYNETFGK